MPKQDIFQKMIRQLPIIGLAIFFNGTILYFYVLFKIGQSPQRQVTGLFYIILILAFLAPQIIAVLKGSRRFVFNIIDVSAIAFFLLIFLNYLIFSRDDSTAYHKIAYAPFLAIAPYMGGRLLLSKEDAARFFKYAIVITFTVMVLAFFELAFNDIHGLRHHFAMYVFLGIKPPCDHILFAKTMGAGLIILMVYLTEKYDLSRKLTAAYIFLIFPLIFLVFRSSARGLLVSLIFCLTVYLFFISRQPFRKKMILFILMILIFGASYYLQPEKVSKFYRYSMTEESVTDTKSSFTQRMELWKKSAQEIIDNPFYGIGIGKSAGNTGFPHNIILEVTAEMGIAGLIVFLLLIAQSLKEAFLNVKDNEAEFSVIAKIVLVLFLLSFCHSMFSYQLTNNPYFYLSLGLMSALVNIKHNRNIENAVCAAK